MAHEITSIDEQVAYPEQFINDLFHDIQSSRCVIWLQTSDPTRATLNLIEVARKCTGVRNAPTTNPAAGIAEPGAIVPLLQFDYAARRNKWSCRFGFTGMANDPAIVDHVVKHAADRLSATDRRQPQAKIDPDSLLGAIEVGVNLHMVQPVVAEVPGVPKATLTAGDHIWCGDAIIAYTGMHPVFDAATRELIVYSVVNGMNCGDFTHVPAQEHDPSAVWTTLVFIVPEHVDPPVDIAHLVRVAVHPRPSLIELRTGVINYAIRSTVDPAKLKNFADHELADRCTRACLGLTATYATEAVFRAISECAGLNDNTVAVIRRLKTDQIAKSRMLRIIPDEEIAAPEDLGGMDRVLADVRRMAKSYTDSADAIKLRVPRGIVLAGVAGTGKTRVATSCAAVIREESGLDFPVIEVDIGSGLGHLVGQSEHSSREAQSIIEALGGCVLLFDEAEKMFAGGQSGEGDSGVMRRVFSGWLKWMQSRALRGDRTFIVMSMNDPSGIPPEMFRRFDATYFVGMPNETVRERIFQIHFRREMALCGGVEALKLTPANWEYLIGQTHNFTGDEIEKIVQYSRSLRFQIDGGTVPTMEDLSAAIVAIGQTTIVKIHHEVIDRLVKWAEGRAIPSDDMASLDATFRQPVIARPASRRSAGRFPHSNN